MLPLTGAEFPRGFFFFAFSRETATGQSNIEVSELVHFWLFIPRCLNYTENSALWDDPNGAAIFLHHKRCLKALSPYFFRHQHRVFSLLHSLKGFREWCNVSWAHIIRRGANNGRQTQRLYVSSSLSAKAVFFFSLQPPFFLLLWFGSQALPCEQDSLSWW